MKWSDLLQWEGSSLSQQAQGYEKSAELLANVRESLDAQLSSLTAHGRTVDAARSALFKLCGDVERQEGKLKALASIFNEASEGAQKVGSAARNLDGAAVNNFLRIGPDGSVHYVGPHNVSPIDAVAIKKNMAIVSGQVGAIMKTAASVVQNTQSKLALRI